MCPSKQRPILLLPMYGFFFVRYRSINILLFCQYSNSGCDRERERKTAVREREKKIIAHHTFPHCRRTVILLQFFFEICARTCNWPGRNKKNWAETNKHDSVIITVQSVNDTCRKWTTTTTTTTVIYSGLCWTIWLLLFRCYSHTSSGLRKIFCDFGYIYLNKSRK